MSSTSTIRDATALYAADLLPLRDAAATDFQVALACFEAELGMSPGTITVQEGFDQGFRLASTAGFAWGEALGMAAMLDVACVVSKDEVKECVCDELWEEHGELKDRFPEKRTKKELAISLAELRKKLKFSTSDERGERGDRLHQVQD